MTIAQGISKITVVKKQSGLGVGATGSGGQILRRETSQLMLGKDTYENNEIASHQQSTGASHGLRKPTGKLNGVLSAGTYSTQFASLLRMDFYSVAAITGASVTIAGTLGAYTVTRASGSFLTDDFKIGDVIRLSVGSLDAANINKNLLITGLTALVATVTTLNGSTMTAEGPIAGTTITVYGKKSRVPLTGHTNDYWTIEDWYDDINRSELYTDMQVAKADVGLPGTGNATVSFDYIGLDAAFSGSQVLTTPTAETTTAVLTAVNGVVLANGAAVTNITGISFSIDGSVSQLGAVVGSNVSPDTQKGRIKVSGQMTGYFQDATLTTLYNNATLTSVVAVLTADDTAASDFVAFNLSAIKLSSDTPDDGEKAVIRTLSFTAEINSAGGTDLANDQTIISIQDSDAA